MVICQSTAWTSSQGATGFSREVMTTRSAFGTCCPFCLGSTRPAAIRPTRAGPMPNSTNHLAGTSTEKALKMLRKKEKLKLKLMVLLVRKQTRNWMTMIQRMKLSSPILRSWRVCLKKRKSSPSESWQS